METYAGPRRRGKPIFKLTVVYTRAEIGYGTYIRYDIAPDISIRDYYYMVRADYAGRSTTLSVTRE